MSEYIEKTIDGIRVYKLSHDGNWTIVDSQKALDKLKSQQQQIQQLTAENEALQARVARLDRAANDDGLTPYQRFLVMSAILRERPQQSLAHIKAEGVREFFSELKGQGLLFNLGYKFGDDYINQLEHTND